MTWLKKSIVMNEESKTNLSLISHPRIQNINQSEKQTEWPISDQNITSQVWRSRIKKKTVQSRTKLIHWIFHAQGSKNLTNKEQG